MQFDVDNVKWLSIKPLADGSKIYAGLQGKQNPTSGLVLSFDNDVSSNSYTYDQALAAGAYTFQRDFLLSEKIFNFYKTRYGTGAGFNGFHDDYKWDVSSPGQVLVNSQTAGPNAWLLLSMIHYRYASGKPTYDGVMAGIASWLLGLQAADGGVRYGYNGATLSTTRSTEQNFDCYAAFKAYGQMTGNATYKTAANNVLGWLNSSAWNGSRFWVGRDPNNNANGDRALDVYSWAPLALSSFTSVLTNPVNGAEVSFSTKNINVNTGLQVDGFDFSSFPGTGDVPADKDAVWLEGTGQMALAYYAAGDTSKWDYYVGQLSFAIYPTGPNTEGMTYATNPGSAYGAGFVMDATHAAASSMAWYLFAKNKFNPFKPLPLNAVTIRNISDGIIAPSITWTVNPPVPVSKRWVLANQYIELDSQPISTSATAGGGWGIQMYTDNSNPNASPRYVDPSPTNTTNLDSSPAGLIQNITGQPTTSQKLPLAWRIQDLTTPVPVAVQPFNAFLGSEGAQSFNWFFFMDRQTPAIDVNGDGDTTDSFDGAPFQDGQVSYDIIRTAAGIQVQQPNVNGIPVYVPSLNPDYIYLEADFSSAAAQTPYTTQIFLEFFSQ